MADVAATYVPLPKNDSRTIFGWCMYDWANSAYITTAITLLPIYFTKFVVGDGGIDLFGRNIAPDAFWGFLVGATDFLAFICAPVLGAIADFSAAKRRFLLFFAYLGALFTVLLYFTHSGDLYRTMFFFALAQLGFINANVVYDAFLPQIASEDKMDWVSGKGYSFGYVGGGIQFGLALLLVSFHEKLGLGQEDAIRIGIASAGLWWGFFTLFTARNLKEAPSTAELPERFRKLPRLLAYPALGISRTWATTLHVRRFKHLALFLVAYMLYNDGIQTVIVLAATYGSVELKLPASALMITILIIQAVATVGAVVFSKLAQRFGTKRTIMVSLVLWSGVVIYAYFIHTQVQFFALGMVVGVVLGGSQALSRSFYGSMVPESASAEFYGFYTVFSKFSSIWGPLVFAGIKTVTGSSRLAIVSLVIFFVVGLILLSLVDEKKAREAKAAGAF
jgi:UMF1 family MFS transporter